MNLEDIPLIETARLRLRAHTASDFDASATLWALPGVVQYIGGTPSPRPASWQRLLTYTGLWAHLGYGYWFVEERSTGRFVGEVGFADFKRDMSPSIAGTPEMGWVLQPLHHGKGYATEAVEAALEWGQNHIAAAKTVCIISPENVASLRVAEKCGFTETNRTTYLGKPVHLFERPLAR